jgi:hypothetical protein
MTSRPDGTDDIEARFLEKVRRLPLAARLEVLKAIEALAAQQPAGAKVSAD